MLSSHLSLSKASFSPFILLLSLALAAILLFLRTAGEGGRVAFFLPPRPFFFTGAAEGEEAEEGSEESRGSWKDIACFCE